MVARGIPTSTKSEPTFREEPFRGHIVAQWLTKEFDFVAERAVRDALTTVSSYMHVEWLCAPLFSPRTVEGWKTACAVYALSTPGTMKLTAAHKRRYRRESRRLNRARPPRNARENAIELFTFGRIISTYPTLPCSLTPLASISH